MSSSDFTLTGVVTKIGMHLTPAPAYYLDCEVSVPNESDLRILCQTIARLERTGVVQNHTTISNIYRQATQSGDPNILRRVCGPGMQGSCASDSDLAEIQREKSWGYWKALFAIYGVSPEAVNANWAAVRQAFHAIPDVIFHAETYSGKNGKLLRIADMSEAEIPHNGFPRLTALPMVDARGRGGGHICFSPLFPAGAKELQTWYQKARTFVQEANFDFFGDFHVYGRYIIAIVVVVYGPREGPRANSLFKRLLEDAHENDNASEYRTHIDYMDEVAGHFDFGDGALRRFVTSLKEHIDPNGILSQGKSGIWSKPQMVQTGKGR